MRGGSRSIGSDGTTCVIAGDLFAIEREASIRWSYPASAGGSAGAAVLGADGTVYASLADRIHALGAQGRLLWDYETSRHIHGSSPIGVDGTVVSTRWSPPEP